MTLKQLEAFYWSAVLGSFSLAAQRLQMTQSSVSKRIEELESSLSRQLFDRSGKHALLTREGERFLPLASNMLELRDRAMTVPSGDVPLTGTLRVGVSEMMAFAWFPAFLQTFGREHPELRWAPHVGDPHELQRMVSKGELDFAVTPGPITDLELKVSVAATLEFSWVASPRLLGDIRYLSRKDLTRYVVVVKAENSRISGLMANLGGEVGCDAQHTLIGRSLTAVVGLVLSGAGIACLSQAYTKVWREQGLLVSVDCEVAAPRLAYFFIKRKDDRRHILDRVFAHFALKKEAAETRIDARNALPENV